MQGLFFSSGIDKGYENDLNRMDRKTGKFANSASSSFATVGKAVGVMGLAVAAIAGSKKLINFSKDLETSLIEVATISGDVSENLDDYKKALIKLSRQEDLAASSADDLAKAYYDVVSAGYDGAEGLSVLEAAARAGTAGFVETSVAADGITTVLNAWGLAASEAANVSDVFFKTVEKGKTTFPELGASINQVAPLAASLGVSFEEVQAAVATITKQGVPTSQAFTQIRSALVGMNSALGDGWSESMTLQEAFQEISDRAGGSATGIQELVGRVEGMSAILATTGANAKVAASDLDAMTQAMGATSSAADKVTQTTEHQAKLLKNNLLGIFESIGNSGNKALGGFYSAINDIVSVSLADEIRKQQIEFNKLIIKIKDTNINSGDRLKLIKQLKKEYPGLLANMEAEKISNQDLNDLLIEGNDQFVQRIILARIEDDLKKQIEKSDKKQLKLREKQADLLLLMASTQADVVGLVRNSNFEIDLGILEEAQTTEETLGAIGVLIADLRDQGAKIPDGFKENVDLLQANIKLLDTEFEKEKSITDILEARKNEMLNILDIQNKTKETIDQVIPDETPKTPADLLKAEELANQLRINSIITQYGKEEELQDTFNKKMLENELLYLKNKQKLTTDALEKAKLEEQIITTKIAIDTANQDEELKDLLDKYQTYISKREKIQEKYDKDILKLQKTGNKKQAAIAEKAKKVELKELDNKFAESSEAYKKWFSDDLPGIAELGIKDLQKEIDRLNLLIEIGDQATTEEAIKQLAIYAKMVSELRNKLSELEKDEKKQEKSKESVSDIAKLASENIGKLSTDLSDELASLTESFISAFDTFADKSSKGSAKAAGLIALIVGVFNSISKAIAEASVKAVTAQDAENAALSTRIQAEITINRILAERQEIQRNSSAFLSANYKDEYQANLKTIETSSEATKKALSGLEKGLVLSADGTGKSLLGLNKKTERFSFSLGQILNGIDQKSSQIKGQIGGVLDPVGIFGGTQFEEGKRDAFNKTVAGFEGALKSLGKTSADMANFSSEEWSDFYTVLDEGGFIAEEGTKKLVETLKESQEAYTEALNSMRDIISDIAGDLGTSLGDALVTSIQEGTSALDEFGKSLNDVLLQMAKTEVNEIFFRGLFDELQIEMERSMAGGDQSWEDDILRFYDKLPNAIEGAESFLNDFDTQMQNLGFDGITGDVQDTSISDVSRAGQISQAITEETGSELVGRMGAIMLSNERIAINSEDTLDYAIQNLVTLNAIKINTDYLPAIAANTQRTYEKLESI